MLAFDFSRILLAVFDVALFVMFVIKDFPGELKRVALDHSWVFEWTGDSYVSCKSQAKIKKKFKIQNILVETEIENI